MEIQENKTKQKWIIVKSPLGSEEEEENGKLEPETAVDGDEEEEAAKASAISEFTLYLSRFTTCSRRPSKLTIL